MCRTSVISLLSGWLLLACVPEAPSSSHEGPQKTLGLDPGDDPPLTDSGPPAEGASVEFPDREPQEQPVDIDAGVLQHPADGGAQEGPADSGQPDPVDGGVPQDPSDVVAPSQAWVNATGNLAGMQSQCGNLTLVAAQPNSTTVLAGIALNGLWATNDSGGTWQPLGQGAGSADIPNRPANVVFDPLHPNRFWEVGIYNGAGIFRTDDNGDTFVRLGDVQHNDSLSVDFTDPARQTMLAGTHERQSTLHLSRDGGETWDDIGNNFPGAGYCTSVYVLDAQTFVVGCGAAFRGAGIYRTTNGGLDWTKVDESSITPTILFSSSGDIYWPKLGGGAVRSADLGQTFTDVASKTVQGGTFGAHFSELPDGRIVSPGRSSSVEANRLYITSDGANWSPIGEPLPFAKTEGVTYSSDTKTLFVWREANCNVSVPNDAIMSAGFDWEAE